MKKWMFVVLLTALMGSASAQDFMGQTKKKSAVKWGLIGGVNVADFKLTDTKVDIENKLGWQLGLMASIRLGNIMSLEPQILYVRQDMDFKMPDHAEGEIDCQSIDVPIALGFKIFGPLRLFAGPVFTLMNESDGTFGKHDLEFSNIRTTLSYTVGAEVRLFDRLRIDVRYNGQFKDKDDVALPEGGVGKMRSQSASINLGYYF